VIFSLPRHDPARQRPTDQFGLLVLNFFQ